MDDWTPLERLARSLKDDLDAALAREQAVRPVLDAAARYADMSRDLWYGIEWADALTAIRDTVAAYRAALGGSAEADEPERPKAGDRVVDGGQAGTLVRCRECDGDGLLLKLDPEELDRLRATPEPHELSETVHACPPDGAAVTPCCGVTPFELPRWSNRITTDPSLVTCTGAAVPAVASGDDTQPDAATDVPELWWAAEWGVIEPDGDGAWRTVEMGQYVEHRPDDAVRLHPARALAEAGAPAQPDAFDWAAIAQHCRAFVDAYADATASDTVLGSLLGRLLRSVPRAALAGAADTEEPTDG